MTTDVLRSEVPEATLHTGDFPKQLLGAIQQELERLVSAPDFGMAHLKRIESVTRSSRTLLQAATVVDPGQLGRLHGGNYIATPLGSGDIDLGPSELSLPSSVAGGSQGETFGATALRELQALLPDLLKQQKRATPMQLVRALAAAREERLDDVAAEIRAELHGMLGMDNPGDDSPKDGA